MKIYGIKNCDTVRKALRQLDTQNSHYEFIDLKTTPLSLSLIKDWLSQQPQQLVNKRSTTYRALKTDWLATDNNLDKQAQLIQANPTVIKRPVILQSSGKITVGYDKDFLASH